MSEQAEQSDFQSGDARAFGSLIARHQKAVFTVAYCQTGDSVASEDLAQEAFLQAWRGRESLTDAQAFRPWVCAIARNLARNENRRRNRHPEHDDEPQAPGTDMSALEVVLQDERRLLLWSCLEKLDAPYREVLSLYYQQGQSALAVAEVLGIRSDLVNQRLKRGRDQLRDQMQEIVLEELECLEPTPGFRKRVLALVAMPIVPPVEIATSSPSILGAFMLANSLKLIAITVVALIVGAILITREGSGEMPAQPLATDERPVVTSPGPPPALPEPELSLSLAAPLEDESSTKSADTEQILTYAIPSDESGTLWYRLHENFPDCARALLASDSTARSSEVKLRFRQEGNHSVLKDATLSGPSSDEARILFEQCVTKTLNGRMFVKDQSDTSVRFSFAERMATPEADQEMLHALPAAVGPAALGPSWGADDAPVVLVIYTDFKCTYCARALSTMDELLELNAGTIRIVTKLYPLKTSSRRLAEATVAAALQDAFWPMHDLVFANQDLAELDDEAIVGFAKQIGIDAELFASDWVSENVAEIVQQDLDDGKALGVQGTPTIFVNYNKIVGAQPIENFQDAIDNEL